MQTHYSRMIAKFSLTTVPCYSCLYIPYNKTCLCFYLSFFIIHRAIRCVYVGTGSPLPTIYRLYSANMPLLQTPSPSPSLWMTLLVFFCTSYDFILSNKILGRFVAGLQTQHWQECNISLLGWRCLPSLCGLMKEFVSLHMILPKRICAFLSVPIHRCLLFQLPFL